MSVLMISYTKVNFIFFEASCCRCGIVTLFGLFGFFSVEKNSDSLSTPKFRCLIELKVSLFLIREGSCLFYVLRTVETVLNLFLHFL